METRSRKRAEATSSAQSTKRTRPVPSVSTRSRSSNSNNMDNINNNNNINSSSGGLVNESAVSGSGSGSGRGRRSRKNNNNNQDNNNNNNLDKGKEKEHEIRDNYNNNINNNLRLSINDGVEEEDDEDDDDDSDGGGVGILHQNLTSASSALQGLLRKLGAGLDDLLPSSAMASASSSHQNGRLKKILSGLRADGEEGKQVEALTQLCDMLSIGTEDSLSTFSVDSFVPVLVGLLNHESNPDIMLLAARALTHLCDVLPSSCAAVVHYGAVSCFVARLLTIEYMDLAEQSLQALKKISQEHPTACLRAGALMAVLSYLDFFSTGVQRVALSTAANMCKKLPSDAADFVMEAVPLLTNLLQYHDAKVLEHASVCLTRIAEAFAASPDQLDELCVHGLVKEAASLISTSSGGGQASLGTSTYTGLIRLLSTCASGSPLGSKTLLLLGISGILKDILSGSALSRPPEQIFEIVNLANELLPPLSNGIITLPTSSNVLVKGSLLKKPASKQEESSGDAPEVSAREKLLNDQPELLQQFGMDLLPVLIQMHGSSVNAPVRHKCLSVIGKLMYFSTADMIQSLLGVANISSFLAGVLAWKDPQVLIPSLQIAEILMEKLPETFSKMFVREGVVHAIEALALDALSSENVNDSIPGSSSLRSRRYRRHTTSDLNASVDLKSSGSPELPAVSSSLRMSVSTSAKAFKDKYFHSDPGQSSEVGITDDLIHLKYLCKKLVAINDQKSKSKGKSKVHGFWSTEFSPVKEENLLGFVTEMLLELTKDDGVSTFEFIGSGVVDALLNYLSCGHFSKERVSEANMSKLRELASKRYMSFIHVALPSTVDQGQQAPMTVLVQKLQSALTSLERFPVVLSHGSRSSTTARLSSGLGALSQPFKLRLCRANGEKLLRDYSSNIVLIDPLASLAAVEDFLWPRVQRTESGQKASAYVGNLEAGTGGTRQQSTRSRSSVNIGDSANKKEVLQEKNASSSKGKGKAVLKGQDEGRGGPQTRNAARRKASLDKDAQMKPVDGESTSEDEDFNISPTEIDDVLVIEDDDISEDDEDHDDVLQDDSLPVCTPDKVHDVKLSEERPTSGATNDNETNPACGSSSSRGRGVDSPSSRGTMSFAAAAMAGLSAANSARGGIRGSGRDRHGRPISGSPRLVFSSGGKQLNRNLTIYQAVQRQLVQDEDDDNGTDFVSSDGTRLWGDIYTVTYQRADNVAVTPSKSTTTKTTSNLNLNNSGAHPMSLLDSILQGELPCDLEKTNPTYNILSLLRVLDGLNQLAPRLRVQSSTDSFAQGKVPSLDDLNITSCGIKVPCDEFVNGKLTPKLSRQIQDALALCSGSLPSWCYQLTKACPFLFPFEIRRQYFHSTAFGLSRALHRLQQQQGAEGHGSLNEREFRVGRLQRQKVRVSRTRILESAAKVMEMYSSQKAVLEVEYFGEVGTGLGPTLEFYTLLSHDLQKVGLRMWRSNVSESGADVDLVLAPLGLFPRPWPVTVDGSNGSQFYKVTEHFRLLGRVMAKALQDGRLLDLPLSPAFYKLVLGQELDLHDISLFDGEFGKTLQELQALVSRKQYLESIHDQNEILNLRFRGVPLEDLCLDFTLPGYPEYVLKTGDDDVDLNNLEEYISLVVDATVKTGITRQMEAFRAGFNQVFDISALQIFSPSELDYLLCGRGELWEADTLVEHIKFDHGYTSKSPAVVNLLEIMGEFNPEQQRAFCQFVTGAPRLPPGGLAVLNPKLTIVRKHSSTANNTASHASGLSEPADDDLPSVMTCANYLKLPPYSTKEIMYKKLVYAISEGQGSFDLS
ncbi:E3 ubiquitin-protein ligase UPL3-like [Bidens hawaiensis]|uniref:E3 ubiquitin-protein ligase UPL3-like n=1 Tax=Bidens hawaiensis TaxID=980011 RepID=UPI00404ABCD4